MVAQFVVELALRRGHIAIDGLFAFFRQVFGDLSFGAPQDEGAQSPRQQHRRFFIGIARPAPRHVKDRCRAEQAGIEEIEQRPQFAEMVFDGGAAQGQPVTPA